MMRSVSPPSIRLSRAAQATASKREATVVLLGCVKTKLDRRAPAKDLYCSRLWVWSRAYAEASARPWLILSAMHGLVEPEAQLDPYDLALAELTARERKEWGERVVRALDRRFGSVSATRTRLPRAHSGFRHR
jgi:hypothetical protein